MATDNSVNFLTLNSLSIERLHEDDSTFGYDYNRLADALDGLRSGVVNLVNPILDNPILNLTVLPGARIYDQSVDAINPVYIDFVLPANFTATSAVMSWKVRNFRFLTSISSGTTDSDSTGESGHSHSHSHTSAGHVHALTLANSAGAAVTFDGIANALATAGGGDASNSIGATTPGSTGTNAAGSSGHSHNHNHTLSGLTASYAEGVASKIDALVVDGVDKTSLLGGPWLSDVINLNLVSVFPVGGASAAFHTIQLTPHGQGRFVIEFSFSG